MKKSNNNAASFFMIKTSPEGHTQENYASNKKAREAALHHFNQCQLPAVVGKVGATSFSVLGSRVNDLSEYIEMVNGYELQAFTHIKALHEVYFAYCQEELKRIGKRTTSREQAQRNADEHYNNTGGPDGGHYTVIETIVKGQ